MKEMNINNNDNDIINIENGNLIKEEKIDIK